MRYLRRGGQVWIRVFADKPVTKKPLETRMGKGKGGVDHYVAVAKRGRMLFELAGVSEEQAKEGAAARRGQAAGVHQDRLAGRLLPPHGELGIERDPCAQMK